MRPQRLRTVFSRDQLYPHSCQRCGKTCSVNGSRSSSGEGCLPRGPCSCARSRRALDTCTARFGRTKLAAGLQPEAQAAPWQSWKDPSCPSNLLWPPKHSSPPSLNVSLAVDPRQSLQLQKLGKDSKHEAQSLMANAVSYSFF